MKTTSDKAAKSTTEKLFTVCALCGKFAPHYKTPSRKSGHQYSCVDCHRRDVREWQRANKDKVKEMRARLAQSREAREADNG